MPDIKQPELPPEGNLVPGAYGTMVLDGFTADQMRAHYAKGRQDQAADQVAYLGEAQRVMEENACLRDELAALKQSLAQPAQEISLDVSTCDADAGNRIFGRIIGQQDGVILAEETSRNFAQQPAQAAMPEGELRAALQAFFGAFDTPIERRRHDDEYKDCCRKRMRELWDKLNAAPEREGGV